MAQRTCSIEGCERPHLARGWCKVHYYRWKRNGSTDPRTDVDRFWARVDRSGECWIWTGYRDRDGYGVYAPRKPVDRAHRFAYVLAHGPIHRSVVLHHSCGIKLCVRPDHLVPMSVAEHRALHGP